MKRNTNSIEFDQIRPNANDPGDPHRELRAKDATILIDAFSRYLRAKFRDQINLKRFAYFCTGDQNTMAQQCESVCFLALFFMERILVIIFYCSWVLIVGYLLGVIYSLSEST